MPRSTNRPADPLPEVIGVYRWPATPEQITDYANDLYGEATPDSIRAMKSLVDGLVVIELRFESAPAKSNYLDKLSPCTPDQVTPDTQAIYDESFWDADGTARLEDNEPPSSGPYRAVFFLHFFGPPYALFTPSGEKISMPQPGPLPDRLRKHLEYFPP